MKSLSLFLFLPFFSININSQIPNGDFEEWEVDMDGNELPVSWDVGNTGYPDKIFKSTDSYSGSYSMGIETNYGIITLGPVKISTKIKPTAYSYNLSLQYKIDSIVNDGGIRVGIYQDDNMGGGYHIADTTINLIEEDFVELNMLFNLPNLDSIGISLLAMNQEIDIGYLGYTRALFDAVELTPVTSAINAQDSGSLMLYPNPANGFFKIKNHQAKHKFLKIYSPLGELIHEQIIADGQIYFGEKGMFFAVVCDEEERAMEVLRLINFN